MRLRGRLEVILAHPRFSNSAVVKIRHPVSWPSVSTNAQYSSRPMYITPNPGHSDRFDTRSFELKIIDESVNAERGAVSSDHSGYPVGPYRVTCDGSHGTHGNVGNLISVSCRSNVGLAGTTSSSSTILILLSIGKALTTGSPNWRKNTCSAIGTRALAYSIELNCFCGSKRERTGL